MDARRLRLKSEHPAGTLRDLRRQLGLSQPAFAALLGVSAESYRTWDTGRRSAPPPLMAKAADLARTAKGAALPLYIWATTTGVHVRTLRQAARDGRLEVSYSARMFFGHAARRRSLHHS